MSIIGQAQVNIPSDAKEIIKQLNATAMSSVQIQQQLIRAIREIDARADQILEQAKVAKAEYDKLRMEAATLRGEALKYGLQIWPTENQEMLG